jgi:acyl carrier protein
MTTATADTIAAAIRSVLADTGRTADAIEPSSLLSGHLGLDSLDLAQTIVILERTLGVDPFRALPADGGRPALRTFGDLCSIYDRACADDSPAHPPPAFPTASP